MNSLPLILLIGIFVSGSVFGEPLRSQLPAKDYKAVLVGKVIDVRCTPLQERKLISADKAKKSSSSNDTKWCDLVYTGILVADSIIDGDYEVGARIPVTWTIRGVLRKSGEAVPPMCSHHHISISQGKQLRFGLVEKLADGLSWTFWEAVAVPKTKK